MPLLVASVAACAPNRGPNEIPEEMLGVWVTESGEYADRSFRLAPNELTIVVDEATQYRHPIEDIEVRERNGRPFVTLHYKNRDGVDDTFRMEYADYPTTFIRLEHLDRIHWVRADESS